jgi:predicted DCC family thiol-disulfide oxidoreductase YuxK
LIGDLFRRWRHITAFYSNHGVLPNHNHIFNLHDKDRIFSILNAFSLPGEAQVAFVIILVVYVFFLVGQNTRFFHLVSLFCLVSLTGRNILLENAGNYAAIALLAFTAFLPLGSRFSLDALRASLDERDEKHAPDLNDRSSPTDAPNDPSDHSRGWSPVSIAAIAVLLQIALIYLCGALQQTDSSWKNGTALYYALNYEPWVSRIGAAVRTVPGIVKPLTLLIYAAEWAIPALILVPVARRPLRWGAIGLMIAHALIIGLLLDFGLYAWTLLAAAPLLVTTEMWEHATLARKKKGVRRTVIYDADCGVCLFITRLLKRVDYLDLLTFQGNDEIPATPAEESSEAEGYRESGEKRPELLRRNASGKLERVAVPAVVTRELVDQTVVVVDEHEKVFTRSAAVAEIFAALPFGGFVAAIIRLPGVSALMNASYDAFAKRRFAVSALLGMSECGIPLPEEEAPEPKKVAPAARTLHFVTGTVREALVAIVFVAMLTQTAHSNHIAGVHLPQGRFLAAVAGWPRMLAKWDVMAPAPPKVDVAYVIDGQTKGGRSVDPITRREPVMDLAAMRGTGMGQLWADYLDRIHSKEWADFQRAFRDYLGKGGALGATLEDIPADDQITGYDAYWLSSDIPAPGEPRGTTAKEKLFTHSRGGRLNAGDRPQIRPDIGARPDIPALRR